MLAIVAGVPVSLLRMRSSHETHSGIPESTGYGLVMDEPTHRDDETGLTRARALARLAAAVGTVVSALGWKTPAPHAAPTVSCILTPEQTAGPYYIAGEKLRRDITEGKPGLPLGLRLKVVDSATCAPIGNAVVEVWHCDAGGLYSGFVAAASGAPGSPGAGPTDTRTFLRGGQRADAGGTAMIKSIYPGWYHGRTVHIHVKVHVGGSVVHTGQLYFPDALTDRVYAQSPYSLRPNRDTRNATDGIFANGGASSVLHLRRSGRGYVGSLTVGVRR
jgi:protocatechuate 3,4-dioxygenase beta subunit